MGKKNIMIARKSGVKKSDNAYLTQKKERTKTTSTPFDQILHLQRVIGNQVVQRLFKSGTLQAKVKIGKPNDKYEKEADRVADIVMRMPEPKILRQTEPEEEEEEPIQAKRNSSSTAIATPGIESSINSLRGGGQPLPESTRKYFKPRFGYDFSGVRVHADSKASETAKSINARAFTKGKNIVFGAGQYSPETSKGRRLLAHELTHVVQQKGKSSQEPQIQAQAIESRLRTRSTRRKLIRNPRTTDSQILVFIRSQKGLRYLRHILRELNVLVKIEGNNILANKSSYRKYHYCMMCKILFTQWTSNSVKRNIPRILKYESVSYKQQRQIKTISSLFIPSRSFSPIMHRIRRSLRPYKRSSFSYLQGRDMEATTGTTCIEMTNKSIQNLFGSVIIPNRSVFSGGRKAKGALTMAYLKRHGMAHTPKNFPATYVARRRRFQILKYSDINFSKSPGQWLKNTISRKQDGFYAVVVSLINDNHTAMIGILKRGSNIRMSWRDQIETIEVTKTELDNRVKYWCGYWFRQDVLNEYNKYNPPKYSYRQIINKSITERYERAVKSSVLKNIGLNKFAILIPK